MTDEANWHKVWTRSGSRLSPRESCLGGSPGVSMNRDGAREWTRYLSADERAKERKKSQMQAVKPGIMSSHSLPITRHVSIPKLAHRHDEGATEAAPFLVWLVGVRRSRQPVLPSGYRVHGR